LGFDGFLTDSRVLADVKVSLSENLGKPPFYPLVHMKIAIGVFCSVPRLQMLGDFNSLKTLVAWRDLLWDMFVLPCG
jgi:hypothetical protein